MAGGVVSLALDRPAPSEWPVYGLALALLPLLWVVTLTFNRAYELRFLGVGSQEFHRVLQSAIILVAVVSTAALALELGQVRGLALIGLPLMALLTLAGRYTGRRSLQAARRQGRALQRVVLVGPAGALDDFIRNVARNGYHGMHVVAACTPGGSDDHLRHTGVPVLGDVKDAVAVVDKVDAEILAVVSGDLLDGAAVRQLGWELEATRASLVLVPSLTEAVGPRVTIRPVCGVPLIDLGRPELAGPHRKVKHLLDRVVAGTALVVLLPLFLALAAVIRLTSRGPAFFRQVRVGRGGAPFLMLKFRTMVTDAELLRRQLENKNGNRVLFKLRNDPRVTPIGRILRRYSIDELPQLINVAAGQMSLVGPRPALPEEVPFYEGSMSRRMLVKPGITGLWQINGRSDLDWAESVRLDLRYVDNWSLAFDMAILWKTAAAVRRGAGAY